MEKHDTADLGLHTVALRCFQPEPVGQHNNAKKGGDGYTRENPRKYHCTETEEGGANKLHAAPWQLKNYIKNS